MRIHSWIFAKPFLASAVLFIIYFLNILIGKLSLLITERLLPLSLGGVVEFLLLLSACIFFVMGILRAEAQAKMRAKTLHPDF